MKILNLRETLKDSIKLQERQAKLDGMHLHPVYYSIMDDLIKRIDESNLKDIQLLISN